MDEPFAALRKFVLVLGVVLVVSVALAMLGLFKIAREAEAPKPPKDAPVPPAEDLGKLLDSADTPWGRADEVRRKLEAGPPARVLELIEGAANADDRRALAVACAVRGLLAADRERMARAWQVLGPPLLRLARGRASREWRIEAVRSLAAFSSGAVSRHLYGLFLSEADPPVRAELRTALESRAARDIYDEMLVHFEAEADPARAADLAVLLLAIQRREPDPSWNDHANRVLRPRLAALFETGGRVVADALAALRGEPVLRVLLEILRDGTRAARLRAIDELGALGDPAARGPLEQVDRTTDDEEMRAAARQALARLRK